MTIQLGLHGVEHLREEAGEERIDSNDQQANDNDGDDNGADGVGSQITLHILNESLGADGQRLSLASVGIAARHRMCRHHRVRQ